MTYIQEHNAIIIKSRTEFLQKVREFIEERTLQYGFSEDVAQNIVLAVDEACTNSIKHGYSNDPNQTIKVEVSQTPLYFEVRIYDKGKTFNPDAIEEPDVKKNIQRHERGGFGLYLMKKLMDKVEFHFVPGSENTIVMRKYREQK